MKLHAAHLPFLTLAVLACCAAPAIADTIKIGAIVPMTGPVAEDGAGLLKGAQLALDKFNAAGGLNGVKAELLTEDGACVPAQSVSAAEKLVSSDHVVALAGAYCSSSTGAVMDVASRYKVPLVSGISTAPDLTERGNKFLFRIQATSQMLATAFAPTMIKMAGGKKVAFLVVNDDWGRSIASYYKTALEKQGATVVSTQIFDTNDTDLFPYITNVKRADPNAIIMAANTQNAISLTEQLRQMDVKAALFAEGSFTAKAYYDAVGTQGDGIGGLMAYTPAEENPANKAFVDQFKAKYNELPNNNSSAGYEEMSIILNGLKKAGKPDAAAIRDAIASGTTDSLSGPIEFNDKGQGYGFTVYLTKNENAKAATIATASIAKPD